MRTDNYHDDYVLANSYYFDIVYKNPLMDDIDLKDTLEQYFHIIISCIYYVFPISKL